MEWIHCLFLFPLVLWKNVVVTCKTGSFFLCSLDNLLQKNVIVFFFWKSNFKMALTRRKKPNKQTKQKQTKKQTQKNKNKNKKQKTKKQKQKKQKQKRSQLQNLSMQWKHVNRIPFVTVGKSIAGNLRNLCQIVNAQAPSFDLRSDLCMAENCAIPFPFPFCPAGLNGSERVRFPILLTC